MAGAEQTSSGGLSATTFFSKTYDEALALAVEARDYVRDRAKTDGCLLLPADRLLLSSETLRLTTRLAEVMAWLMLQRAYHAGEVTEAEVRDQDNRLANTRICMRVTPSGVHRLPPRLRDLLQRSERLYRRVARLDEMVMREAF